MVNKSLGFGIRAGSGSQALGKIVNEIETDENGR